MQVFIDLDPSYKGQTCGEWPCPNNCLHQYLSSCRRLAQTICFLLGLCGNFNDVQTDDFKTTSGVIEGTSAAFGNTWKTRADCPDAKNTFEDPCTVSIQNGKLHNLFHFPLRCKEGISWSTTKYLAKLAELFAHAHAHTHFSSIDTRSLQLINNNWQNNLDLQIFSFGSRQQVNSRKIGTIQHIRDSSLERTDGPKKLYLAPLKVVAFPLLN